jgi:hypothetical protein
MAAQRKPADKKSTLVLRLNDPTLFGNDAGEEEDPEILASYFVDQPSFELFFDRATRLRFARARKGMGKSALLAKMAHDLRQVEPDSIVIQVTGSDLTGLGAFTSPDPSVQLNQWQQVMCARISQEIGREIGFAADDASMLMVESAELAGLKDRNILRALVDRLAGKVAKLQITRPEFEHASAVLRRVQDKAESRKVWLLIDDVDFTFVDNPSMRLKVGTFFSACRKLAREVKNLNIRASVRTDVWSVIRGNEDLDKAEQYMTDIAWTRGEMELILSRRILSYVKRNHASSVEAKTLRERADVDTIVSIAFARRINWGGSGVPPIQALNVLSARRPRWMSQLCRLAGEDATRSRATRIEGRHILEVMRPFGELRLADLYKEHGHQFGDLRLLVETFAGRNRTYTTAELLHLLGEEYMRRTAQKGIPRLEGRLIKTPMELAHFLFRIGFLQGQNRTAGAEEFVNYENRPDLLTNEINPDDRLAWGVYPSYRNVLRIK